MSIARPLRAIGLCAAAAGWPLWAQFGNGFIEALLGAFLGTGLVFGAIAAVLPQGPVTYFRTLFAALAVCGLAGFLLAPAGTPLEQALTGAGLFFAFYGLVPLTAGYFLPRHLLALWRESERAGTE